MTAIKGFIHATYEREVDSCVVDCAELRIHYTFRHGHPGQRYMNNGDPGFPPEPHEIELDYVEIEQVQKPRWVRTPDWDEWAESYLERNEDRVCEDVNEREQDAAEYRAECRADAWRDE